MDFLEKTKSWANLNSFISPHEVELEYLQKKKSLEDGKEQRNLTFDEKMEIVIELNTLRKEYPEYFEIGKVAILPISSNYNHEYNVETTIEETDANSSLDSKKTEDDPITSKTEGIFCFNRNTTKTSNREYLKYSFTSVFYAFFCQF